MGDATPAAEGAVSFDSVLSGVSRVVKRTRVCLDGDLMARIEQAEERLQRARETDAMENRPAEAPGIAAEIVAMTEQARAREVEFAFQYVGRRVWRDLIAEHPPTDEHKAKGADFNTETFPIAAMALACISPTGATQDKFQTLSEDLTDSQWNRLWVTCHAANTGGADIPLSEAAYALARGTETSSARRGSTGRRGASS